MLTEYRIMESPRSVRARVAVPSKLKQQKNDELSWGIEYNTNWKPSQLGNNMFPLLVPLDCREEVQLL